ncbi:MAG: autotransporter domain-containing protein [Proteobacteria bacterium]|nr:autotransporter domain-containing protein [Pseudomonadota bacterium]
MRFDVYKRALMLTAATMALLSGPAYAASNDTPLKTSTSGDIDLTSILTIPSSSNASTTPAITIDSNNKVTVAANGSIVYTDTASATGIFEQEGFTGESIVANSIDLGGKGASKTGILIGSLSIGSGTFTGVTDATNNSFTSDPTAVVLQSGAAIKVQGDGSDGIRLATGSTLAGDIIIGGTIGMTPTNVNATTSTSAVTGIELDGTTNGSLIVGATGAVSSIGAGGQGVLVLGQFNGAIENFGSIQAAGVQTATQTKGNPVPGSAFIVSNNVTGGIYNAGPLSASDTTQTAVLNSTSSSATVLITPGVLNSSAALPVTIGGFADPGGLGTYSFINRGNIINSPQNINTSSTAVNIIGLTATNSVTLTNGLFNTGAIRATALTDSTAALTSPVVATGLQIGNYTNLTTGIVNSNNGAALGAVTGVGTISATFSGQTAGIAAAVTIAQNANVPSFTNGGLISASAVTTDTKVTSLSAIGVLDQSGTLLNFNNSGTITTTSTASVNSVSTPLDNRNNLATALDLRAAQGAVTLTNTGAITGDVLLGEFNDTVNVTGSAQQAAVLRGNLNLGGGNDTLTVGSHATVTGDILEGSGGHVAVLVQSGGALNATNNGATTDGQPIPAGTTANLSVSSLEVQDGGTLGLTLADGFNINRVGNAGPIVQATPAGTINMDAGSILKINFGGFVSASAASSGTAQFVVFDATSGNINIANPSQIQTALTNGIPFLFNGSACGYNVGGFTGALACTGTNPQGTTHSDIILTLSPKSATDIGLTGYAKTMFDSANVALANDAALGAAVINAGAPVNNQSLTPAQGQALYQKIYSGFAPDVTGSARAVAISLTDQSTGIVADRQRKLRMYASQDGDITLWAQEYGQRLNVPNTVTAGGYSNSGFGIVVGGDGGSISSGRYGAALTFYTGDTHEKVPRDSKTTSEWYMLTGYSDWRGKGLFFDSQINVGYGTLKGRRVLSIDDLNGNTLITRTAVGKRATEMASGGFSTGFIFNSGGTVLMPQLSVDALTLREEGYTESGGGAGMDLHVQPYYANSVRAFLGADLRQDLKMGDFFLQPELRAGYRYDFINGQEKLKVNFAGDQTVSPVVAPGSQFTITGPDPAKGNVIVGGGLAVTTDAWSVGVTYDYARGIGGTKGTNQDAMLTLIGRI